MTALGIGEQSGEWRVLAKFVCAWRCRHQQVQQLRDVARKQAFPVIEPTPCLPAARRPHLPEILRRERLRPGRIGNDAAGDRVGQPQASLLVTSQGQCPVADGLEIGPANSTMGPDGRERQLTRFAEIHDMLPRGVEERRRLAGRQQIVVFNSREGVVHDGSHRDIVNPRSTRYQLIWCFLWLPSAFFPRPEGPNGPASLPGRIGGDRFVVRAWTDNVTRSGMIRSPSNVGDVR